MSKARVDAPDTMIAAARWAYRWAFIVFALPLILIGIGWALDLGQELIGFIGIGSGLFALMKYMELRVPTPDINVENELRVPLLVLRSFSDDRLRTNEMLRFEDGTSGRMNYVHQASLALWDVARTILIQRETDTVTENYALVIDSSNEHWRSDVERAATNAWAILIFPSNTQGVVEEMKLLGNLDVLWKTVVFMPPSCARWERWLLTLFGERATNYAERWASLREQLREHAFELPEFRSTGLLYIPNREFGIAQRIEVSPRASPWRAMTQALDPERSSAIVTHCIPLERTRVLHPRMRITR